MTGIANVTTGHGAGTRFVGCMHAALAGAALCLAGCGDLSGFGGAVPALATIRVQVTGDFASVQAPGAANPTLRVALMWGAQWLTEPLCIRPPDPPGAAAVIAAGCRDPFGFVPDRVAANAPLQPDQTATIELFDLPAADVMVGDVTARVAYASLVVYDDRDGDGTLTLGRANRLAGRNDGPPVDPGDTSTADLVYAGSFVSMTQPDTRLAYREGGFNQSAAFYPRAACGDPLPSFSIVSAGGFTAQAAIAAQLNGQLPQEDPASCREVAADAPISLVYRKPAELHELACEERTTDSTIRYREPPASSPDLTGRTVGCAKVPVGTGKAGGMLQVAVSGRSTDSCVGLTHYVLRGCREDALCELPDWDISASPPPWWPDCARPAVQP